MSLDQNGLKNPKSGRFSRVATGQENSTWVCEGCGSTDADPWEDGCAECGAEPNFH